MPPFREKTVLGFFGKKAPARAFVSFVSIDATFRGVLFNASPFFEMGNGIVAPCDVAAAVAR